MTGVQTCALRSVVDRAGKLVADVDAETAAGMQHPLAFVPDKVQVIDVALVTLMKADLVLRPIVLELPVGWRSDNKVHRPVARRFICRLSPWIMVWWLFKVLLGVWGVLLLERFRMLELSIETFF